MAVATERFTFTGASGGELSARLDLPVGIPKCFALFAHCFTCTKDIFAASRIAESLTNRGIAVLRFDFTGLGSSEGEFANSNFSSNVGDLVAAANHMREHLAAPEILIGHSLGGSAVLVAARHIPESRLVSTIGAPADPSQVAHIFKTSLEDIERTGEAEVVLAGRPFHIRRQFVEDIRAQNLNAAVRDLKKALLIFHSPVDQIVSIDNAGQIFQAATHPKSYISLAGADHLLSNRADAAYVAEIIATWSERYISADMPETEKPPAPVPGTIAVAETGAGKYTNVIVTGSGHIFGADEPRSVGGNDSGPSPYDLLLGALGACKNMTMRMYADRKNYDLERVEVRLSHDRIHAEDCAQCETRAGQVGRIRTEIDITGNLSDEERQKIFNIAGHCPVHRTITGELLIESRLKK